MNANPSPGNKAGGLTTILEKSLGAMAKAGSTNLVDVVGYAEQVTAKGFVFMDTPGYDPVAATGQVAGGANMVCFTTGRGSVFGCKPAPSDQAGDQHADVQAYRGRYGRELRHHPGRGGNRAGMRGANIRIDAAGGERGTDQERERSISARRSSRRG